MSKRQDTNSADEFAAKAKALFDESVEGLDGETRSRLNRGRQAALAELGGSRQRWTQWLPATGVAAAAVAAVMLWSGMPQTDDLAAPEVVADMEILLTEDSFEMLQDLEFYSWIDLDDESEEAPEPANHVG